MLQNVNTTDLHAAIALGCQTMASVFNKDDNDIPFFNTCVWPTVSFGQCDAHNEAHVPGRHLNALLMAEAYAGIAVEEDVIRKQAAAAYFSFSSHIPMPLNRKKENGKLVGSPVNFYDHNIREGLHALYALSRFRQDPRADELMLRAIDFLNDHFLPEMAWDATVTADPSIQLTSYDYIAGVARAIGPLVKYYRASNYTPALELAIRLAEKAKGCFPHSGEFDAQQMGTSHVHSISCVMSSLAQLAETTQDRDLMERVRCFYDKGMYLMRNELGWAMEVVGKTPPARGECNTSGDILETALILGKVYGADYYADAERILRGHILPSQIRDISFIKNPENPNGEDCLHQVAQRHLGAFGFPAPYGHQPKLIDKISFNMDIVGGTVASICEAYAACTAYDGTHRVNLLFDIQTDAIAVTSPYHQDGMTVTVKKSGPVFLRLPPWADRAQLQVSCPRWAIQGDWLHIPDPVIGKPIAITYPLAEYALVLHSSAHTLRTRMRGDTVLEMDNEGTDFTFFAPYTD